MKKYLFISTFTCGCLLINSCARNPVTGKSEVVLMSEAQEIEMGKGADPQIIAQYGLYNDSSLQNFINAKENKWLLFHTAVISIITFE